MFRKILLTLLVIIAISAGVLGYLYYKQLKVPVSAAINAIPNNACFIIETKNTQTAWRNFSQTSIIWKDMLSADLFRSMNKTFIDLDSIIGSDTKLVEIIEKQSLFVSVHTTGINGYGFLFSINLPNSFDEKLLDETIKQYTGSDAYYSNRIYEGVNIYQVKSTLSDKVFSYALFKGIFISSFSGTLMEESVKQIISGKSLSKDSNFNKVFNTTGTNVDANVYVNYESLNLLLNNFVNLETKNALSTFGRFANWSALDVKAKPNAFLLNGFTYSNDSLNNYLNILKNQVPQNIQLTSVIPRNTASFLYFGLSNSQGFLKEYKKFLSKSNKLEEYQKNINDINLKYSANVEGQLTSWIGNEMAALVTETNSTEYSNNHFVVIKASNTANALQKLEEISTKEYFNVEQKNDDEKTKEGEKRKKENETESTSNVNESGEANTDSVEDISVIRELKIKNTWETLLGNAFSGVTENYYTVISNYIVFANNIESLRGFVKNYKENKTLKKDDNYGNFSENLSASANFYIYSNLAKSGGIYQAKLSPEYAAEVVTKQDLLKKFEAIALQISCKKDMYYNNIYLKHNPVQKQETNSLWETELDTTVSFKPKVVINHINQSKEIFVQDDANNIYLISNTGKILWQTKIEEKILSDIYQVDRFKNDKLQMVFNTKNYLYMVDRNGKNVTGFPVKLDHPANNELSVFDYENNREYRLMIALDNKKTYNYNVEGKAVGGWKFDPMPANIKLQIQHFSINEKDYLVLLDSIGNICVFDRRGGVLMTLNNRIKIAANSNFYIEKGKDIGSSKIVATDINGNIISVSFNDELENISIKPRSANHYFDFKDINNDKKREYIFVDKNELSIYDQSKTLVYSYKFQTEIKHKPLYFLYPDGSGKIGIVSHGTNEIFLFNNDGSLYNGFPFKGNTYFSISDINNDEAFNVIVGSSNNSIYTYSTE